ncbi:MAG: hypothetical protein ACYC61_12320 [Isosphaeraceae bacterium]
MPGTSMPAPLDGPGSSPPLGTGEGTEAGSGGLDPESIRQAHRGDEAYVKGVGRLNVVFALFFLFLISLQAYYLVLHLRGQALAPWSVSPGWLAYDTVGAIVAVLALVAAYGMWRLRSWALRVEVLFVAGSLLHLLLAIVVPSRKIPVSEMVGMAMFLAGMLVPLVNLLDLGGSPIFTPEYREAVAATGKSVRVRARFPWAIKIPTLALILIALALLIYSVEDWR